MLTKVIAKTLRDLADRLEAGDCNDLSSEDLIEMCKVISSLDSSQRLSKEEACRYMNMSRSVFDGWVYLNIIPRGSKQLGFKELSWNRGDLDIAKEKIAEFKEK